jgi:hypothetical protein
VAGYRATACTFLYVVIRTGTGHVMHPASKAGLVARPSFRPLSSAPPREKQRFVSSWHSALCSLPTPPLRYPLQTDT